MQPHEQFGENLRRHRRAAGLSQEELGRRSDFHTTEISRLERGVREPRLSTVVRLARALGLTLAELLEGIA